MCEREDQREEESWGEKYVYEGVCFGLGFNIYGSVDSSSMGSKVVLEGFS